MKTITKLKKVDLGPRPVPVHPHAHDHAPDPEVPQEDLKKVKTPEKAGAKPKVHQEVEATVAAKAVTICLLFLLSLPD